MNDFAPASHTQEITLSGFKTQGQTTQKVDGHELNVPGQTGNLAGAYTEGEATTLLNNNLSNLFNNLPDGTTVQDVSFEAPNNTDGSRVVVFYLSKYYNEHGTLMNEKSPTSYQVKLTGFKTQGKTALKNPTTRLDVPGQGGVYADKYTSADIESFINGKLPEIFNNLPDGATITNVTPTANVKDGTISVSFKLNKYLDDKGDLVEATSPDTFTITLGGFKTDGFTTTLPLDRIDLTGMGSINAGSITNQDSNPAVTQAILAQVKDHIQNLAHGAPASSLEIGDIQFTAKNPNNAAGTIVIDITITNNKA